MARGVAAFLLGAILAVPARAQGPSAEWKTIVTAHFRIHYPVEYELWARRVAGDIESVREAVVREVGYSPTQITDVLIVNPIAEANGVTLPFLDVPRILLFPEPPEPGSQIGEFRTWIDIVTTHEMTHLIHLLRPSRNPTQHVIEKFVLPISPIVLTGSRWLSEGYATVVEGRITGSGRPAGSLRAAILRKWAVNGRLPSYSRLNSDRQFLGMSMAYLVGSAYLEWLEQRAGPGSLQHLWARLTARHRRGFDEAFIGVFGDRPDRLYALFTAELTDRAMAVTRNEALHEGELWQETSRNTGEPAVSPDGTRIALVNRDEKGEAKLEVLSTGPNPEEKKFQDRIEKMLKEDPQDVAPVRTRPLPRKPLFTLRPPDGGDINTPRWTRDGKSILYSHRQPDREGFLHHDLFLWTPGEGNRRVTDLADVTDADPLPDGMRAIAVRNRHGLSQLVFVDISTGEVTPQNEPSLEKFYSHPRASAAGRLAWAEHDAGGWKVGSVSGAFSPEWSGTQLLAAVASGGFVDIARIDNGVKFLTRSAGVAVDPAPSSDGSLYFMSLEPDGFVVRRLPDMNSEVTPLPPMETRLAPAIPVVEASAVTFNSQPFVAPRAYGFGQQEWSVFVGGAATSFDSFGEIGVRFGDVVGRIDSLAIIGHGEGALISTWRGWPVAATAHAFSHGLELRGEYETNTALTNTYAEAGGLAGDGSRVFAIGQFEPRWRALSGTARIALDSKQHSRALLKASSGNSDFRMTLSAEAGRNLALGGVASSMDPDALLLARVLDPALPADYATLEHYHGVRAEVTMGMVSVFWQRHSGDTTVRGIEAAIHAPPVPLIGIAAFDLVGGFARVSQLHGTQGWISLRWRP